MQITTTGRYEESEAAPPSGLAAAAAYPGLLRKVIRNIIESWPSEVYDQPLAEVRRFGRHTVFVCDPALIRSLLVDQGDRIAREDFMITALSPLLGRGILTSDGPRWRAQRRMVAPVFRPDTVTTFVPAMRQAVERTIERWSSGGVGDIDLLDEMMRTTFDIIYATTLPDEPSLDVAEFARSLDAYLDGTGWKIALTMLKAPRWMPHPGSLRAARAARRLRTSVADIVARRRTEGRIGTDLLGLMMQASDPDDAGGGTHRAASGMSDEALTDNLLTFVAAGHETTALAMSWTFRLLAEHPRVEARLRAEIAAAGSGASPDDLPYARQVLMESMRLYPPAPLIVRQAVKDVRLGGRTFPAGSSLHVPVYAVHRHQALWQSPETFDPDRFAPGTQRERYSYLPFGGGPQSCVGMGFAMTECLVILAGLLPRFRFETLSDEPPAARFKVTLRPHGGMPMRVVARTSAAA